MADYGNGMDEPVDWIEAQWVLRDPEGRIVAAWTEGGYNADAKPERYRFAYDHNGERVAAFREEIRDVEDTIYTLRDESGNVLSDLQWTKGGSWSRLADRIYLGRDEQVRIDYRGGSTWTFTTTGRDHLGTGRAEVYGNNDWRRLDLWPYGEIRAQTPHNATKTLANGVHLFTGHERDFAGTTTNPRRGMDYMHARYYTFNLGRFLSVDPVGGKVGSSQNWNRYAYVRGNPLHLIDPDGRDVELAEGRKGRAIRPLLVALARTSTGRAELLEAERSPIPITFATGHLNDRAVLRSRLSGPDKQATIQFGSTTAARTFGKSSSASNGSVSAIQVVVDMGVLRPGAPKGNPGHPTDASGLTTIAHEMYHVMDLLAGKTDEEVHKGDLPSSSQGPAEKEGSAVAHEKKKKRREAEKWLEEHILGGYHAD